MRIVTFAGVLLVSLLTAPSAAPGQTAATDRVMREKLVHSQRILEAIMLSDYALLGRESEALSHAIEAPGWAVLKSPEYLRQSAAFVRATHDLIDAATARDMDSASVHYVTMTLTCYQCHRHLKNSRIAGR